MGRFREEGLLRGARSRRTRKPTPALRWFAEDREKDTPDWGPAPWDQVRGQGTADDERQDRVRGLQPQAPRGKPARSTPSARSWDRSTSSAGKATTPRNCTTNTHSRWSPRTRSSASTPWATRKDSWTDEIKDHRVLKEDGQYYWIMRVNARMPTLAASAMATSSAPSTTAAL